MKVRLRCLLMLLAIFAGATKTAAQGTAFTYQGRLNNANGPATGSYDLTFTLYDDGSAGNLIAVADQPLEIAATLKPILFAN